MFIFMFTHTIHCSPQSSGQLDNLAEELAAALNRPSTAIKASAQPRMAASTDADNTDIDMSVERPYTMASQLTSAARNHGSLFERAQHELGKEHKAKAQRSSAANHAAQVDVGVVEGREFKFWIRRTWGDQNFVGLTSIAFLDRHMRRIDMGAGVAIDAYPRDINSVPGHSGDTRTLDKLVDGVDSTVDDNHMWLAPCLSRKDGGSIPDQWLSFTFAEPIAVAGVQLFNYNKNAGDTHRGVKYMCVSVDGKEITPNGWQGSENSTKTPSSSSSPSSPSGEVPANAFLVGKAPGHAQYDSSSLVSFTSPSVQSVGGVGLKASLAPLERYSLQMCNHFSSLHLPTCSVLTFQFISTWSDPHYIGLQGIEVYDDQLERVHINPHTQVHASPASLADTSNLATLSDEAQAAMARDIRTVDKLFDGVHGADKAHSWLVPFVNAFNYMQVGVFCVCVCMRMCVCVCECLILYVLSLHCSHYTLHCTTHTYTYTPHSPQKEAQASLTNPTLSW
jgi:hypothetical protein